MDIISSYFQVLNYMFCILNFCTSNLRIPTIETEGLDNLPPPPPPPPPPAFQDWSLSYNPENNYPDSLSPPSPPSPPPPMSSMSTSSRLDEIISIRGTLRRAKKEKSEEEASTREQKSRTNQQYHMSENQCTDSRNFTAYDVDDYESELNFAGVKVVMSPTPNNSLCDNNKSMVGDNGTTTFIVNGNIEDISSSGVFDSNANNDSSSTNSKQQTTIRSHRGTVRGVRNRVRQGIATFLLKDPSLKVIKVLIQKSYSIIQT